MAITPEHVAVELGRTDSLSQTEQAQWELWISDARMLIQARLGDLAELDQSRLDYVVRQAVAAQVRRPDDATVVDVSVDDGRESRTYRSSAGRVTIRDEWWALLSDDSKSTGAFSIVPGGAGFVNHLAWCAVVFGANWCSCGADIAGDPIFELLADP